MECAYCGHDKAAHQTLRRRLPTKCHMAKIDSHYEVVALCPCRGFVKEAQTKTE